MLTQRQRRTLTQLQSRHGRRKADVFVAEGVRVCGEALQRQPDWVELLVLGRSFADTSAGQDLVRHATSAGAGSAVEVVDEREMVALAATESPQGALCVLRRPTTSVPDAVSDPFVLVLDRVREPGNLGTILRTAWAVGLDSVWLTEGCADPFEAKVVRAGMGAQFAVRIVQAGPLVQVRDLLAQRGRAPLYLTLPNASLSCFDASFELTRAALVIGNEADGIGDLALGPHVTIPMPGHAESVNAAQAATVILFDAVRRGIL